MPAVNYDWDDVEDNIVEEYDDASITVADNLSEPNLYGNLISQNRGGVESQYHFDAQGSTLAMTDDSQQVTAIRAYTAYGETTETSGITVFPFQFIGQIGCYRDSLTGQYTVRQQPTDPITARWLAPRFNNANTTANYYAFVPYRRRPSQQFPGTLDEYVTLWCHVNYCHKLADFPDLYDKCLQDCRAGRKGNAPRCEVTLVCWPAFQGVIPPTLGLYHCEYRVKRLDWWYYHMCRCGAGVCNARGTSRCVQGFLIPCRGYRIPVPTQVPACVSCGWQSLSWREQYYKHGYVEMKSFFPAAKCDCIEQQCGRFPASTCYGPFNNSNTGAKCVDNKCSLNMPLPPGLTTANLPGWDNPCPAEY